MVNFTELPISAKALYFLLGLEADDEGFVNPKSVMRVHGGSEDDLKILAARNLIILFPSGVIVITDWNENNYLNQVRIKPTKYIEERKHLILTIDRKYEFNKRLTRIGEDRIGEDTSARKLAVPVLLSNKSQSHMNKYNETSSSDSYENVIDADTGEAIAPVKVIKATSAKMAEIIQWAEKLRGGKFANYPKQMKALAAMRKADISPADIKQRYENMANDRYWQEHGFDFMNVLSSFDRKPVQTR